MFVPIILVCLASVPADKCAEETALDVIRGEPSPTAIGCAVASMQIDAPLVREGTYVKVRCAPAGRAEEE